MSSFTLNRRSLDRFRRNHKENKVCWDRNPDKDSFFSVIDTHNHFRPFGGPAVEFDTYLKWMQDAGIIFSTMFGIGQLIKKTNGEGKKMVIKFLMKRNKKSRIPQKIDQILYNNLSHLQIPTVATTYIVLPFSTK